MSRPSFAPLRRAAAAFCVLVLAGVFVAACGGSDAGRINPPPVTAAPLIPSSTRPEPAALNDPEAYGLPTLAEFQSNPGGVATALLRRQSTSTWNTTWQLRAPNDALLGEMILEHLPADAAAGTPAKFHAAGTLGSTDTKIFQLAILDQGAGPRICVMQETKPWVCDVHEIDVPLQFLSVDGFETVGKLLRESLAAPGLQVQYAKIAGVPSACFYFPPIPVSALSDPTAASSTGVDLSEGGSFCLSTEGVLTKLKAGPIDIVSSTYKKAADPAKFTLPVTFS